MITDIVTLCHSATIVNNQISMLGAFDTIFIKSVPSPYPAFTAVVRAYFSPDEIGIHRLILRIVDPDGRTLGEMNLELSFVEESFDPKLTLCIALPINGMELRCLGEYAIDLILDDNEPIRMPFYVKQARQ
jgi:hypothetical protein